MSDSDVLSGGHEPGTLPFRSDDAAEWVLSREVTDGPVVVRVFGEVDLSNAEDFRTFGRRVLSECTEVEIDLSGVTFIDSTGLRGVVHLMGAAAESGTTLTLSDVSPRVRRVFELTGLVSLLDGQQSQHIGDAAVVNRAKETAVSDA